MDKRTEKMGNKRGAHKKRSLKRKSAEKERQNRKRGRVGLKSQVKIDAT